MADTPKTILAAASGGGHWIELLRLRPAFVGQRVVYTTVREDYRRDIGEAELFVVNDATSWNWFEVLKLAARMFVIVLRVRPDIVVSTGAAPGFFALLFGKLFGARTIWVDSLANVDQLSRSGRMAGRFADLWLTQWPELASEAGPEYAGKVL